MADPVRENQLEPEAGGSIKVLKAVVIGGGIALLVGFGLLFLQTQQRKNERQQPIIPPVERAAPLMAGGRVISMVPAGPGVALLAEAPGGGQELLFMDREGVVTRRVRLNPEPSPTPASKATAP